MHANSSIQTPVLARSLSWRSTPWNALPAHLCPTHHPARHVSYTMNPSQQFQPLMTLTSWAPTSYRAMLISDTIILLNVRQLFLSQHKSSYFSTISVFSIASSQHTDSKYVLNETNIKPVENKSQDCKKIWDIIQINSLPKCFHFPTSPSEMISAWITPVRGNSLPHKTSTFKKF